MWKTYHTMNIVYINSRRDILSYSVIAPWKKGSNSMLVHHILKCKKILPFSYNHLFPSENIKRNLDYSKKNVYLLKI